MLSKRTIIVLGVVIVLVGVFFGVKNYTKKVPDVTPVASQAGDSAAATLSAKAATAPVMEYQGQRYAIIDGAAYRIGSGSLQFVKQLYDPNFYSKNYQIRDGKVYRKGPNGTLYPVLTQLTDGFESASGIQALINPSRGWTSMTLLSPSAPTVNDYVQLRNRILQGTSDFIDNRVEPSVAQARTGQSALRLYAVAPGWRLPITKASLDTELLHFKKGNDVWFTGWYYISQGRPLGLLDLESSFLDESPGMRLLLSDDLQPRLECKWGDKFTFHASRPVFIPTGKWVNIRLHLTLSDQRDGQVQLWIDSNKVIDATGQTLPLPDTVYDRMQIGITANPKGTVTEMFVDDVLVSQTPIP